MTVTRESSWTVRPRLDMDSWTEDISGNKNVSVLFPSTSGTSGSPLRAARWSLGEKTSEISVRHLGSDFPLIPVKTPSNSPSSARADLFNFKRLVKFQNSAAHGGGMLEQLCWFSLVLFFNLVPHYFTFFNPFFLLVLDAEQLEGFRTFFTFLAVMTTSWGGKGDGNWTQLKVQSRNPKITQE